jgi:hypothetical protein
VKSYPQTGVEMLKIDIFLLGNSQFRNNQTQLLSKST